MVEILITIGVILILVSIGVIAYRGLDKMASERTTHVALDNGTAMLAEYEHGGNLQNLVMVDPNNKNNFPTMFWVATQTNFIDTTDANVDLADVSTNGNSRTNALAQNGVVVFRLIRLPKNKSALSALPQKALIEQPSANSGVGAPAIADGWRNPILFCPAGGVQVYLHFGEPNQAKVVVTSPDHRPFWVSAGPDGDLSKGDDNVYSFSK
jgi:hypothetical protein